MDIARLRTRVRLTVDELQSSPVRETTRQTAGMYAGAKRALEIVARRADSTPPGRRSIAGANGRTARASRRVDRMGLNLDGKTAIQCSEDECVVAKSRKIGCRTDGVDRVAGRRSLRFETESPTGTPPHSVKSRAPLPIVDFGTRRVHKSKGVGFRPRGCHPPTPVDAALPPLDSRETLSGRVLSPRSTTPTGHGSRTRAFQQFSLPPSRSSSGPASSASEAGETRDDRARATTGPAPLPDRPGSNASDDRARSTPRSHPRPPGRTHQTRVERRPPSAVRFARRASKNNYGGTDR